MFNRPYWRRVWIYQEATTPGHIHFICGNQMFNDILLSATLSFGLTFSTIPGFDVRFIEAAGYSSSAFSVSSARLAREKGRSRRLIELMVQTRKTVCTDPRDKVYAPLGHATDVAPGQITVDYRRKLVNVYMDVAEFALYHPDMSGLEILGQVFTPASDASHKSLSMVFKPRMLSWVPDRRQRMALARLANSSKATPYGLPLYNPCPRTRIEARVCGTELELNGHIADETGIETLTNIWDDTEGSSTTPRSWYNNLAAADPVSADLDTAIRQRLVGDRPRAIRGSRENNFSSTWKRGGIVDWNLIDSDRDQLDQVSLEKRDNMFNDVMNVCYGRRMARLTDGRVAILPAAAKIGDQVAAFHGGNSLYLVRSLSTRQGAYTFIGECYVDGWMDGVCKRTDRIARRVRLV